MKVVAAFGSSAVVFGTLVSPSQSFMLHSQKSSDQHEGRAKTLVSYPPTTRTRTTTTTTTITTTGLYARIIGWNDDDDTDSDANSFTSSILNENEYNSPGNYHMDATATTFAERLSHNQDKIAQLARLAVAFSPKDQCLNLQDINHVGVISVDGNHIKISAVVCEDIECVTLCIPVSFPHDCNGLLGNGNDDDPTIMEECVLENLFELDLTAQDIIKKNANALSFQDDLEEIRILTNDDDIQYPKWWVYTSNTHDREMMDECMTVQRLLNADEFQESVNALAMRGLEFISGGEDFQVLRAKVVAVSPAGLYLRARARFDSRGGGGETDYHFIDIPYSFGSVAGTCLLLRSAVLGAVAAVSE